MTTSAGQPVPANNPESIYHAYLTTDVLPAIRAASARQMRHILRGFGSHLCHQLRHDIGDFPGLGPDRRQPWQVCEVGSGMSAGFQLHRQVTQAVAGSFLHAMGFDPGRAIAEPAYYSTDVAPALATARKQPMRCILLRITYTLGAVLADSDDVATASAQAAIPDDLREAATGLAAAIQLYRHAVRAMSVHVLGYIWEGLDLGDPRLLLPYTAGFTDAACFSVNPN